jgi:hypothetical protein
MQQKWKQGNSGVQTRGRSLFAMDELGATCVVPNYGPMGPINAKRET